MIIRLHNSLIKNFNEVFGENGIIPKNNLASCIFDYAMSDKCSTFLTELANSNINLWPKELTISVWIDDDCNSQVNALKNLLQVASDKRYSGILHLKFGCFKGPYCGLLKIMSTIDYPENLLISIDFGYVPPDWENYHTELLTILDKLQNYTWPKKITFRFEFSAYGLFKCGGIKVVKQILQKNFMPNMVVDCALRATTYNSAVLDIANVYEFLREGYFNEFIVCGWADLSARRSIFTLLDDLLEIKGLPSNRLDKVVFTEGRVIFDKDLKKLKEFKAIAEKNYSSALPVTFDVCYFANDNGFFEMCDCLSELSSKRDGLIIKLQALYFQLNEKHRWNKWLDFFEKDDCRKNVGIVFKNDIHGHYCTDTDKKYLSESCSALMIYANLVADDIFDSSLDFPVELIALFLSFIFPKGCEEIIFNHLNTKKSTAEENGKLNSKPPNTFSGNFFDNANQKVLSKAEEVVQQQLPAIEPMFAELVKSDQKRAIEMLCNFIKKAGINSQDLVSSAESKLKP